jgi:hypothetical protein
VLYGRPGDSRGGEVVDVSVDLLLDLSAGLHQLVQMRQALATSDGPSPLRRR